MVLITTRSGQFAEDPTLDVRYRGTLGTTDHPRDYSPGIYETADDANALFGTGTLQQHNVSLTGGSSN